MRRTIVGFFNRIVGLRRRRLSRQCIVAPTCNSSISCPDIVGPSSVGPSSILDYSGNVTGPDVDANSVRDNIDAWIANQRVSLHQTKSLTQLAGTLQSALTVNLSDPTALESLSTTIGRSINCIWSQFDNATANRMVRDLGKITVNTPGWAVTYFAFADTRNGSTMSLPGGNTYDY